MKPTNPSSHGARGHQLHPPEEMHNEGVAHERSDIDIRAIVASILALFTICVTVVLLMGGLFKLLDYRAAQDDPPVSPVARPASVMPRTYTTHRRPSRGCRYCLSFDSTGLGGTIVSNVRRGRRGRRGSLSRELRRRHR